VTPREEEEIEHHYKRPKDAFEKEKDLRTLNFSAEQKRIVKGVDKYFSAAFTTTEDIEREKQRLISIEESSRQKALKLKSESLHRSEYLREDHSALKIQRMYRGHLGRKKYSLNYQIKRVLVTNDPNDWIEVLDKETGDTWYYNKITQESQWTKPAALLQQQSNGLPSLKSKKLSSTDSKAQTNKKQKSLEVSMSLPSLEAMKGTGVPPPGAAALDSTPNRKKSSKMSMLVSQQQSQKLLSKSLTDFKEQLQTQKDIDSELGISRLNQMESLTGPDGAFKPQLRNVVIDALLDTRFDNVATVLADTRWFDKNDEIFPNKDTRKELEKEQFIESKVDPFRQPLVSVVNFNKKKVKKPSTIQFDNEEARNPQQSLNYFQSPAELTLNNIEHTGFEDPSINQQTMCFGCWSAGLNKRCSLHDSGRKVKASETMLLCRNWELEVMKRRYRSEEIQELFMKKESSLRYNAKYHRFYTVIEQKHPIYRMSSQLLERFNARMTLFLKIKYWLGSLAEEYRQGKVHPSTFAVAKLMRIKRGLFNLKKIERFSTINRHLLPISPITGYSWPERCHEIQHLYQYFDKVLKEEVDMIKVDPIPVPKKLYEPKEYHIPVPQTIPLLNFGLELPTADRVLPSNTYISDLHAAAWLEKLCSSFVRDKMDVAMMQIKSVTPITTTELKMKTKRPTPHTLKYATLGTKPLPGNMAVGGLPLEFLVYLIVSTYFPPQYGNFVVMDKSTVSPGVSPEITISFESLVMPPTLEAYIERPLEHPLSYRRPPTITINSNIHPNNKHFYGVNRPEQTGEQEAHGFRTTTWAPMILTDSHIGAQVFVPGQEIVSLNATKANVSNTTHADHTYPFCEPSTRDNSTLDFYHLLLTGVVSLAKAQVFTALTIQEPGEFQKAYRRDVPLGHLVVAVYRSWSFAQSDTIQEFKTDDGVSYWYHRKTGQTFWERPLYDDENKTPLEGGTVLDMQHPEEPTMMTKGAEGASSRYTQGDFRKNMLAHLETKKDALNRRKAASVTVKAARQRGVLPEPAGLTSVINNPADSVDFGSRIEFGKSLETSLGVNQSDYPYHQQQQQQPGQALTPKGRTPTNMASSVGDDGSWVPNNQMLLNQPPPLNQQQQLYNNNTGFQNPTDFNNNNNMMAMSPMSRGGGMNNNKHYNAMAMNNNGPLGIAGTGAGAMGAMMPGGGMGGFDTNIVNALSQSLGSLFTNMMHLDKTNPQDMIQLGMGMGMVLMQTGAVQNMAQNQLGAPVGIADGGGSLHSETSSQAGSHTGHHQMHPSDPMYMMQGSEEASVTFHEPSLSAEPDHYHQQQQQLVPYGGEPIGKAQPTILYSTDKSLDHREESQQRMDMAKRFHTPLNTMEIARNLKIEKEPGVTPDERPPKVLTNEKPSNAEEAVRDSHSLPVVAYPELSTVVPGGAPNTYQMKPPAGLGTSYVAKEDEEGQLKVEGHQNLRRTVLPLPVGFFDAIEAKHVAKQAADYLPQVPNLPQSRTIGRVKPRSAASDWLMINFDPWSAGKNPLGTERVTSLMAKADKFLGGGAQSIEQLESLRQNTIADAYVDVKDQEGLAQQKAEISKAQIMAQDFRKLCSLCRHSKFSEAEQLINQPDWAVPIDYQDDQGNALIHIAAQNGSKRLVKLCLRRGASLNLQNLNGQTALHFAFGYGYTEVGDYLVSKGADDSIRNKDSLTCYEGLEGRELALL
jgi:hypothetical protein